MTKQELRKLIRERKKQHSTEELKSFSREIASALLERIESMKQCHIILLYHSLPDEVCTHDIITFLVASGRKVLLPTVVGDTLQLHEYVNDQLMDVSTTFGIQESQGPVFTDYSKIDLAVIPGMAFTPEGDRLGRGKGYYDRLIPLLSCPLVGLAFPFQMVDSIPTEPHDKRVDEVIVGKKEEVFKPLRIYKSSAGSGKTFTLAVEYIALLAINPMEYQNILAVTFTNKATAEMKQRILGTLYGIANGLEGANDYVKNILNNLHARLTMPLYGEEPYRSTILSIDGNVLRQRAKEALSNIVHDYSRFRIETIDSFFQGIVRELANELELSTNLKVELDETEVLSDAVDRIIETLRENSSEFKTIVDFIEEEIRANRSWQVNETVKEFGRNIFKENYLIHSEEIRKKITDIGEIYKYRTIIHQGLEEEKEAVMEMGRRLLAAYDDVGMTEKDGSSAIVTFMEKVGDYRITEPTNNSRGTFSDSIEAYTEEVGKWFKKSSKNRDALEAKVKATLMPMLEETFSLHAKYVKHLHTVTAIGQHLYSLMLLSQISQMVKLLNEENNRFLLSETANFLRNVINNQDIPFIYEKTGACIKHIMIDEFQDTSTLQWSNFKPLIMNCLAMDGSCLIVGDVKQSIYRFRNSDWQILNSIEADKDLAEYIGNIPAKYNFRSSKRVVDFNNKVFENATKLLQHDCPALSVAYNKLKQKPKKLGDKGFVKVENIDYHQIDKTHLPDVWDKDTPENYHEATLQRMQLSVKELMDNGVDANDITILVRVNREVPLICDYFNAHQDVLQVKVVSDDAFRLDASPAVVIIIDALRVLASPQSSTLNPQLSSLMTLEHHYGKPIPPLFDEEARKELRFKALTEQVEDIYRIFQLNQLKNQDAYLLFFYDIVNQFCEENLTDLDSFLKTWDDKLCEKTIPNGASDGVRIMTIHKSKGLEFHSVIIPFYSWSITPKENVVMWCIPEGNPYNQMPLLPISVGKAKKDSIFNRNREDEELRTLVDNINVLYVAFTRAKHNLVILTGHKIGEKKADDDINDVQSLLVKALPDNMEQTDIEGVITCYRDGTVVPTSHEKKEQERNVMECEYEPLHVSFNSYPPATEFKQSYESDLFITKDSLNPHTQRHTERIRLISLGNLYHHIFQHIHTLEDVPHAIQLMKSRGCFGTLLEAQEAQKKVTALIEDITPQYPEWFSDKWQVLNERAILFLENQTPNTKRPDRVIVCDHQAIIIDYKTAQGVVKQNVDGTFVAPHENRQQIEDYKKLLRQIGYTNIRAYLWYILDELVVPV